MEDSVPNSFEPGPIALFGSGETSPSGQKIFDQLFRQLPASPRVTILETPAGFELNSPRVAGRVGEFLEHRLQNYNPRVSIIPARRRGTPFSPDEPTILEPILRADLIFMGPGSPSYTVRQLQDSLAWQYLIARHRLGAALALASAATIAISAWALPVYEIYKVGEDLHWKPGLDFFGLYGLNLVFIPHWDNTEGGEELDTSRCFMGLARFEPLLEMLPEWITVVGIDEKTGLVIDLKQGECTVVGSGSVTVIRDGREAHFTRSQAFSIARLGDFHMPDPEAGLPPEVYWQAQHAQEAVKRSSQPPAEVMHLVEEREAARQRRSWARADALRAQIAALGWQVMDTGQGPVVEKAIGGS